MLFIYQSVFTYMIWTICDSHNEIFYNFLLCNAKESLRAECVRMQDIWEYMIYDTKL